MKIKILYAFINEIFLRKKRYKNHRYFSQEENEECLIQTYYDINKFSENDITNLSQEIGVISQLNHPSIAKFIGYCPFNFDDEPVPTVIKEFSCGTLDFILAHKEYFQPWDDTQKLIVIYGIASAMSYIHSNNIIHRDLKPENIQLDEFLFPKLTGFHLSKELPPNSEIEIFSTIQGTPAYLSPEIYTNKEYSKSSDVYAFSLIVYEIITNNKPFKGINTINQIYDEVVNNKKMPEIEETIPECYRKLIDKCWSYESKERPTFKEILEILRTDSSFITDTINSQDYLKYIKHIDESTITFNSNIKITYEDIISIPNLDPDCFRKNKVIQPFFISVLGIYFTEFYNVSYEFEYFNINKYTLKKKYWT